ncbi:lytic transglycosylase domain-containing protein [Parvularcula sp. ZS-1/3]|uniref:Lytic transglycosylase domain-containing protein n=1 Tax=Parvularcula mediterranea TaxID=2732508 RepID=A0A7Y3W6A3_9PROT|nr:lytic transglycosylase domain-containing protein [Parvularcula mediterranea]NNU17318.1 lytic transglycosylase domain-containing protein [Parvularcula mediterranea]
MDLRAIILSVLALAGTAAAAPPPSLKPEPPASPYISRVEANVLRDVFESLDDRRYEDARTSRGALNDPLARKIAEWALLSSNAKEQSLEAYDIFLDQNEGWPNPITLQRKAEALIDNDTPAEAVVAFFDTRDPVSGFGKLQLGRALIDLGSVEVGKTFIRKAWVEHNFTKEDSREILNFYGRYLTRDDHFAKADRALFNRSTGGVEDVQGLLTKKRAAEIAVRSDLIRGRSRGLVEFERLPRDSRRDPGVLHAMVRYLRRSDKEAEAIQMAGFAPLNPAKLRDADAWFYERKLLARWALREGRFDDAYRLSAYSGLQEGADFAEAEFMAGWVALRFLGDPGRARAHFDFLTSGVTSPISLARGNYWLGRAYDAMGDDLRAKAHYLVASDYPYTFYGQMAIETLGRSAPLFAFPKAEPVNDVDRATLSQRDLARALHILDYIDQDITFRRFALALDGQLTTAGELKAFAEIARDAHEFDLIVRAGKVNRRTGAMVPEIIYPLVPIPAIAKEFAEEPLILGLSRQESEFKVNAYSRARAKGMMQLLDSTARITARKEKIPFYADKLLTDADYNFTLGAAHLSHLLERFGGSYIMVLAGYNAGPHRVDRWVEEYGDPRDPSVDPIDWIELIPFSETRNYVMRVLENTQVYRSRLSELPLGLQLTEDITRGSASTIAQIGQPLSVPKLFTAADTAPEPILTHETFPEEPAALVRAAGLPAGGLTPLSPNGRPVPVSNR